MLKLLKKSPQKMRVVRGPFQGAEVFLNPANSMRKLFGIYEHVLNDWIADVVKTKNFAFDVGANTGYDTYGLAHLLSKGNTEKAEVIAIEPEASQFPELLTPKTWSCYSQCNIEIIEKFASSSVTSESTTLDTLYAERDYLAGQKGLVKIDVEGAETEVLQGSSRLLENTETDWLIEIHGRELIAPVCKFFTDANRPFLVRELTAIPFLGPEQREIETFWLTTVN